MSPMLEINGIPNLTLQGWATVPCDLTSLSKTYSCELQAPLWRKPEQMAVGILAEA